MARQAEAERERRAKVINAKGELQASEMLAEAARTIGTEPAAIQLRFLQTVTEIAAENNSTTLFPLPLELFRPFLEGAAASARGRHEAAAQAARLQPGGSTAVDRPVETPVKEPIPRS